MNKKYALLMLYPAGNFSSGNKVLAETLPVVTRTEAIVSFQSRFPSLELNGNGYAKHGEISYCVAECLSHY